MLAAFFLPLALAKDIVAPDYSGEWESVGDDHLTLVITSDHGVPTVKVTLPSGVTTSAALFDAVGSLRFSTVDTDVAYHCIHFGDPDTLLDDVVYGAERGYAGHDTLALHRSTPELRAAAVDRLQKTEVVNNLNGLRTAELAYDAAFDTFVDLPLSPRPIASLDAVAVPFPVVPNTGYALIGWAPAGDVTASYSGQSTSDHADFTLDAWQDLDHDGVPAHWQATRDKAAFRVTPEGVR